jgi:hypothetical protein
MSCAKPGHPGGEAGRYLHCDDTSTSPATRAIATTTAATGIAGAKL